MEDSTRDAYCGRLSDTFEAESAPMKEFWQIDAFTTEPFCGNPAAVVFDTDDKSTEWMQAVSREMNLSETVFFGQPTTSGSDYRVRFFTPRRELRFAGHPTIAAAHAFIERYRAGAASGVVHQECEAGIIPIQVRNEHKNRLYVMEQRRPEYRDVAKPAEYYAGLLGCANGWLATGPVQVVSTGAPWVIVRLCHGQALHELAPDFSGIEQECRREQAVGITVFALTGADARSAVNVRTFAPGEGVPEDPVCGSGNGAVGAYLARHLFPDEADFEYQAFQGLKVNRPGQVFVHCIRARKGDVRVHGWRDSNKDFGRESTSIIDRLRRVGEDGHDWTEMTLGSESQNAFVPLPQDIEAAVRLRMDEIPIFRTLGFRELRLGRGSFESTVPRDSRYDGIFECFHGGLLMTIADSAAAMAILTVCGPRSRIATTDMNIRFLAPALNEVKVRARLIKAGRTLVPVEVNLWNSTGGLVAVAQVNYIRLDQNR